MKKTVMVVDDSVFIYEEIKFMLNNTDYEITAYAKSGEEAIELFRTMKPDVVTMDVILPGLDGIDAAREILKIEPGARIVIVSSLAYDETLERAKEVGASEFLYKPIEKEALVETLDRVYAK